MHVLLTFWSYIIDITRQRHKSLNNRAKPTCIPHSTADCPPPPATESSSLRPGVDWSQPRSPSSSSWARCPCLPRPSRRRGRGGTGGSEWPRRRRGRWSCRTGAHLELSLGVMWTGTTSIFFHLMVDIDLTRWINSALPFLSSRVQAS